VLSLKFHPNFIKNYIQNVTNNYIQIVTFNVTKNPYFFEVLYLNYQCPSHLIILTPGDSHPRLHSQQLQQIRQGDQGKDNLQKFSVNL
jgi:hypothetical protein